MFIQPNVRLCVDRVPCRGARTKSLSRRYSEANGELFTWGYAQGSKSYVLSPIHTEREYRFLFGLRPKKGKWNHIDSAEQCAHSANVAFVSFALPLYRTRVYFEHQKLGSVILCPSPHGCVLWLHSYLTSLALAPIYREQRRGLWKCFSGKVSLCLYACHCTDYKHMESLSVAFITCHKALSVLYLNLVFFIKPGWSLDIQIHFARETMPR